MPRSLALLLALTAGCSVALDMGDAAIACKSDGECPAGRCEVSIERCVGLGEGTPLRLTSVSATSVVRVVAVFNQPIAPLSVVDVSQASIEPPLTVSGLELDSTGQRLALVTSEQTFDVIYSLTVTGLVSDRGDALDDAARTQAFVSFLGQAETGAPAVIRPRAGDLVTGSQVELVWQPVQGAGSYTVEVSKRDEPGSLITILVPGSETSTQVSLPDEATYDWRVRADVTAAGLYATESFDRVIDSIYVSCPPGDCPARTGNGSKRDPLKRIGDGIVVAQQLGLSQVRVAARAGDLPYDEVIVLGEVGLRIDGGFDATFVSSAQRARVTRPGTAVVVRPASGESALVNLMVAQLDDAPTTEVVSIEGGAEVSMENVDVSAGRAAAGDAVGVSIDGGIGGSPALVTMTGCDITARTPPHGRPDTSTGIRVRNAALDVSDTRVRVGLDDADYTSGTIVGLRLEGETSLTAYDTDVGVGNGDTGIALDDQRPARVGISGETLDIVDASRLWVLHAASNATAVWVEKRRSLLIRNSVIGAGEAAASSKGIFLGSLEPAGDGPRFTHDLVTALGSNQAIGLSANAKAYIIAGTVFYTLPCSAGCAINHICLSIGGNGPSTFLGNALACPTAYIGTGFGVADLAELVSSDPNCDDGPGRTIRCGGIVDLSGMSLATTYVDFYGADDNQETFDDAQVEYLASAAAALRNGGPNLSADTCGYEELPPVTCGASNLDADGAPRAAPLSMGPYEY